MHRNWRCCVLQFSEIYIFEKRVIFHSLNIILWILWSTTKSLQWVDYEKLIDQILGIRINILGKCKLSFKDQLKGLIIMLSFERNISDKHEIKNTTKCPKVHRNTRYIIYEHFWWHIKRCSDKSTLSLLFNLIFLFFLFIFYF
jgi:hypothetical protein